MFNDNYLIYATFKNIYTKYVSVIFSFYLRPIKQIKYKEKKKRKKRFFLKPI